MDTEKERIILQVSS